MRKHRVTLIAIVAALGGLLFGFDTAIISGAIPYIKAYFVLGDGTLGWAVSSILIGCAIGAAVSGKLADQFGRRTLLIICAVIFALSGIGAGLADTLSVFIAFRIIGGLGVGAAAMVSPMYIAEIVPSQVRGRWVSLYQLAIVSGILLAYGANYLFDGLGSNNWRWMFASQAAPALMFFGLLLRLPETPRWLIQKGRVSEALSILEKTSGMIESRNALAAIQLSFSSVPKISWRDLSSPAYRPVIWLGALVAVFQQVTGINAVLYYAPVIFKETGLSSATALLQTIGVGVVNVVATFIAIGLVDKLGRRFFLLTGSAVMGISLLVVAVCFHYRYYDHYLVLVFMLIYVAAFGCTLGAVTWVYLSEIFPNRVRSTALSIATLALWLADFIVAFTFPVMVKSLGIAGTFVCYGFCCALAYAYIYFRLPETKGKSLEEIENLFMK